MFWKHGKKPHSLMRQLIIYQCLMTMGIVLVVCVILFPKFDAITHYMHANYQHTLWVTCIRNLILALLFSLVCSIGLGYWIAKKNTRTIQQLSDHIELLSFETLAQQRIDTRLWPDELTKLGASFNGLLNRLCESYERVSQFSSDIAHELRNPLHHLLSVNEVALMQPNRNDASAAILEANIDECQYLLKMIDNLLFIARSDHGQIRLDQSEFEANAEIANICDYYEALATDKNITIHAEGHACMQADKTLFKRVISNVLANAIHYSHADTVINIHVTSNENEIRIQIIDQGIGIVTEHLNLVFDRFYRVDASRTSETGGTGLGLAIVKSIMDLHKGRVDIQSILDQGTSVSLYFPIVVPACF